VSNIKLSLLRSDVTGGRQALVPQVACQSFRPQFTLHSATVRCAVTDFCAADRKIDAKLIAHNFCSQGQFAFIIF
jgi:hypothetical protein